MNIMLHFNTFSISKIEFCLIVGLGKLSFVVTSVPLHFTSSVISLLSRQCHYLIRHFLLLPSKHDGFLTLMVSETERSNNNFYAVNKY